MTINFAWLACVGVVLAGCAATGGGHAGRASELAEVEAVLTSLHEAAARAQFDRYMGLYADDAVFLGTDATERWTLPEFKAFAKPYFDAGKGWTYHVIAGRRHVAVDSASGYAWFDEALTNAKLGECRGSGVLRRTPTGWKIVQYNLTMPVPNAMAEDVAKRIGSAKP